jgi:hypothetical protein
MEANTLTNRQVTCGQSTVTPTDFVINIKAAGMTVDRAYRGTKPWDPPLPT